MKFRRIKNLEDITRIKFGIREKILVSFLAVSLVAVGVISIFALRNMAVVGNAARQNSIDLGQSAVAESVAALEDSGRRIIQLKAGVVAKDVQLYIERHQEISMSQLLKDSELKKLAIQTVGQTGSTMLYGNNGIVYFNEGPTFIGGDLDTLAQGSQQLRDILESSLKDETAGYYEKEDQNGNIRAKYIYTMPVAGTSLVVAATTYIDEFSRPAAETESKITSAVLDTTRYIERQMNLAQWTFIIIIICMVAIVTTLASFMARTITDPIKELINTSGKIASGDLDRRINVKTGDEIELLSNQFNTMTSALKESYSNLEQKVEERTKQERQRAEQLRTINEISRKISSIINLDELLPYVANLLRHSFDYHNVNIYLFEPLSGKLVLKEICLSGYEGVIPLEVPLEMGDEGIVAWVAQTGEPLLVNDVSKEPRYKFVENLSTTKSELAVAVKIGNKILGVLDIESDEIDAFSEADLSTAQTLADQLAIGIENARLYKETGQIAVMEERNRMAREIHDTLAQGFTGIILQLEAAEQAFESNTSELVPHLNKAKSLARLSLSEARRSVWNLRPEALEKLSLTEAMKQEVAKFSQSSSIAAKFNVIGNRHELPPDVDIALLRICQESLTNARKHSKARQVTVDLIFDNDSVVLAVKDNGTGFKSETPIEGNGKRKGFGLISMRDRTRNIGGTFDIQSEEGKGTQLKVVIPLN